MTQIDDLIEATITHFMFDRPNRNLRIDLVCAQKGPPKLLIAEGVDYFLIDDMKFYNIVDRVTVFENVESLEEISECASCLFFLLTKQALKVADMHWPTLSEKLLLIQGGKLRLMEIEPVYGASAIVLAQEFRIE